MSQSTNRQISVPAHVVRRAEARLPETEFDSLDEYLVFILDRVLRGAESHTRADNDELVGKEELESRLESLGYL